MARKFITADYEATLDLEISLREVLPPEHLARFLVEVIAELDLSRIYRRYGRTGAPPYAPEMLLDCSSMTMPQACSPRARSSGPPMR